MALNKAHINSYGRDLLGESFTTLVNSAEVLSCVNILRAGEVGGLSSVNSDQMLNPHKTQRLTTIKNEDLVFRKSHHTDSEGFPLKAGEHDSNKTYSLHSDLMIEDENGEKIDAGGKVNPDKIMSG